MAPPLRQGPLKNQLAHKSIIARRRGAVRLRRARARRREAPTKSNEAIINL